MSEIEQFDARCREAIRGVTFFGRLVEHMDAESLLLLAGYLVLENSRLMNKAHKAEMNSLQRLTACITQPPSPPATPPGQPTRADRGSRSSG